MVSKVSGSVTYANGIAASGVEVRVFDRDAPGKIDDDLTLSPGVTDPSGRFTVEYDPGRYLDFARVPFLGLRSSTADGSGLRFPDLLDILSPYLRFSWILGEEKYVHEVPLELFQSHFTLPQTANLDFLPSKKGFQFMNSFTGYMLPFSVPFLSDIKIKGPYGLCGGMVAGTIDYLLAGCDIPAQTEPPRRGTRMHRYLFRRAIDSFAMGEVILRFARWMLLPNEGANGTYHLTWLEWEKVRKSLDKMQLVPLGQLRAKANNIQEISRDVWLNHQVLAYGYTENTDGSIDIRVYDPNCPKEDNATIHGECIQVGEASGQPVFGLKCYEADCFVKRRSIYGFFTIPYQPVDPPAKHWSA